MGSIFDIPNTAWRDSLVPASFRSVPFHCETVSLESGRRIVMHEFPKKDLPYAEDMGKHAHGWTVRGYIIAFPINAGGLYNRDYRIARDALSSVLEQGQPGYLQMPTMAPMYVYCQRWRLTEEEKFGGYCSFDMVFVEYGLADYQTTANTQAALATSSQVMRQIAVNQLGGGQIYQASPAQLAQASNGQG
jgi:prophage DNA circulation protein